MCFPVITVKFLKTPFLQNTFIKFQWLIPNISPNKLESRKNKDVRFNFLQRKHLIERKLLGGNSAITEFNELKNIYITLFRFTFYLDFSNENLKCFTFSTLNPRGKTRLIFKRNISKRKHGKDFFSFGFLKKPPKKDQVNKQFFL